MGERMNNAESMARQGYQAYCEHMDWQEADSPLPKWEELPAKARMAWQVVAVRIVNLTFHRLQHGVLGEP